MPTITNFGDVVTTGNTVLQGNLSVLNQSTFLTGNLLPNVAGSSNLGQAGTPFGSSWITSMNATSLNVTSANITSLNVSSTINIAGANVATLNVSSLNVSSENVSSLNVSSTAFIAGANITTANVSSLNVTTGANVSTLTVSLFANILSANIVTANHATLNVTTANVASLNVSTGANVSWLTVTTGSNLIQSNIVTANVGTGNISTANVSSLNVSGTAFLVSANLTTANVSSFNVTSGANVTVLTVSTLANIVSANVVTANIGTANVLTENVVSLNVSGTAFLSNANVLTGNITTANVLSLNVTGDANIAQNLTIKSNLYTSNIIMSSNLSTNTGQGNVYVSANLVVNGNIYSIGGSVGSGSGTSQGVIYALGANYTLGAPFVTGSAGPSIAGYHIDLSSFSAQAVQAVSSFSATSGMLKFTSAGLYQVQLVLVGDQAVSKVGIGSTSSGSFAALPTGSTGATSGYVYVYNYVAGSSPSTLVTIPLNITDVSKWYYLDTYFSTAAGTPTIMYPTAPTGGSSAGSNYGTFVQVSPFGNYLTSATGVAAGLLCNCSSSSNLSGSYSSNAYRVTLTTANGWTVNGTSTAITAPTANGYFTVNQAGIYEVSMCLNTVGGTPVQFQLGSLSSDTAAPGGTTPSYLYTYAPMYTQDPTTTISMPVNITNISNVYFVECSFQGSSTANIALSSTSTFLSIKPVGSYVTPATNPWSASGSLVYYSNGAVGIGTSGSPTETLTVYGNTSFVSNVTVTSDASSNTYVNAKRVPAGSLSVANYVTGSVPLTTTTNLIQNYLSNAATVSATGVGGFGPALSCPAGTLSGVIFQNGGHSANFSNLALSNIFVEAWIYRTGSSSSSVVFERAVGGGVDIALYISAANPGTLTFFLVDTSGTNTGTVSSGITIGLNGWVHVAATYIRTGTTTGTCRVYVNGTSSAGSAVTSQPRLQPTANIYVGIDGSGSNFQGYIADVRVMTGSVVPVGSFTAPSTPAAFTTAPTYVTGMNTGYTSNLTLALNSQYFPGASTSPYGPCLTLPGTVGSYYSQSTTALNTSLNSGFTIEAWVNYASLANSNTFVNGSVPFMMGKNNPTGGTDWLFGAATTGQISLYFFNGSGGYTINTAGTITTGSWNHLVAQANTTGYVNMYINGVQQTLQAGGYAGSGTAVALNGTVAVNQYNGITIGQSNSNQGPNFALAKARVLFGANTYTTTTFTPNPNLGAVPAGATVAWSLDSQYPLPTYPSIQDVTELPQQASSYGALPTPVGGVTSNVLGPYTANTQFDSIRFDGTGYIDYGNAASSVMTTNLWANAWTIEAWVYPTSFGGGAGNNPIFCRDNPVSGTGYFEYLAWITSSGYPTFNYGGNTGGGTQVGASNTVPLNTWTHIAWTYDGARSNIYFTTPGISQASQSVTAANMTFTPTWIPRIGLRDPVYSYFQGNLADLRVSNVARYSGTTYVVPSAPFATDSNTLLLLKSLGGQVGTTLEIQGRGLNAVSLGATRSVQSYPPAPMSSYLLDTTSNSSVSYGVGKYVASASSEITSASYTSYQAFDKRIQTAGVAAAGWEWAGGGSYSTSSPYSYTGSVVTVDAIGNSYAGEWLQIQMPVSIILSSFALTSSSDSGATQGPATFYILGSRDGINWTRVSSYNASGWGNSTTQTFSSTASQAYNYYRLVVSTLIAGGGSASIMELTLNGTEESLCITSDSKVGVGIANPQRALEVAGDLVVSGTISGGAGMGSFRNRIINGDMRIAQRGTSFTIGGSVVYTIDRWRSYIAVGSQNVAQQTLTASDSPYQLGFKNSLRTTITSPGGTDQLVCSQNIEGYNIADLNWGTSFGTPITISFWFRSNLNAGSVLPIAVRVSPTAGESYANSYVTPFTTVATGAWQYVTASIPPPPNGIATATTNTVGLKLDIGSYSPSAGLNFNSWSTTNGVCPAAGVTYWVANAGNYIEFTGVQLEKGTVATPFEFRPYATELQLCYRYYQQFQGTSDPYHTFALGQCVSGTQAWTYFRFLQPMRAPPTLTSNAVSNFCLINAAGNTAYPLTALAINVNDSSGVECARLDATASTAVLTAGNATILRGNNTTLGYIGLNAEL